MNYKISLLTVFVALVYLPASSFAQNVPAQGSTIKGPLVIGRSTFALPPGEWRVAVVSSSHVTGDGSRAGYSEVASVQLVQSTIDGAFVATILYSAPLVTSHAPGSWTDNLCDRRDTLHRDDFSVNPYFPECLLIDHIVNFGAGTPRSEAQKKRVKLPATVLSASYRKYFSGDFVTATIIVNPESLGQESSLKTVWAESEWHPRVIKNDPKRLEFVEKFKKWSYVMAENARSTLMDRKPKSTSLPTFDDFRIGLSQCPGSYNAATWTNCVGEELRTPMARNMSVSGERDTNTGKALGR